jgi:hypothetical protein
MYRKKDHPETAIFTAYDDEGPWDDTVPERSLLLAILTNAITDLSKEGELKERATAYLLDSDEEYLFSFRSICHFLDVDPVKLLSHIDSATTLHLSPRRVS